jgi:hypothetical protein
MTRLILASLAALALAALVAVRLGGALGAGVVAGAALGTGLTGLSVLYQRHVLQFRPERALSAAVVTFGVKLLALLLGALAFRFVDAAAERADWRAFLVAFAAAVAIVLPLGVSEAVGAVRAARPRNQPSHG